MEELCYFALDIAAIIGSMGLGCRAQAEFLNRVWENERPFLQKDYRDNKRQMILDVSYWLAYFSDKPSSPLYRDMLKQQAGSLKQMPILRRLLA